MNSPQSPHLRARRRAMILSLVLSIVLMTFKFTAYFLTNSAAILSDALESIINVVASSFALWSVILAATPPDRNHPYGHGKIEYFSAGFEGALIILAALGIFYEAAEKILHPTALPSLDRGLLLLAGTSVVNLLLGMGLVRVGRRTNSLAVIADGKHILTDVYTSGGVIVGLLLVLLTGWYRLDGIIACLAAANIVATGVKLVRESYGYLMHETDQALLDEICAVLTRHRRPLWIDVHRLRAWRAGERTHVDFHLILPRDLSLEQAHAEVKAMEAILAEHFNGQADILIHIDPCCEPDECPVCAVDRCTLRTAETGRQTIWTGKIVTGNRRDLLPPKQS